MRLLPFLLAVPLLLATGCAKQSYATKLKLPALESPAVLAPVDTVTDADVAPLISGVEKAMTPSQADTAVTGFRSLNSLIALFSGGVSPTDAPDIKQKKQDRLGEMNHFMAYMEQAGQIKRAQLEDGDSGDGTGEVGERLKSARQCWANIAYMNKSIPGSTSGAIPQTAAAPALGAAANLTQAEALWVRTCHEGMNGIKPNPLLATLRERYYNARPWTQAKQSYEALLVPPRFAKADVQFRQGYAKAAQAVPLLEEAQRTDNYDKARQADGLIDEAKDFMDKGFAEIKAAGGE